MAEYDAPTDRAALDVVYRRDAAYFARLAFVLTGSSERADDLVQEAFARVTARVDRLRDRAALRAYLRRTVVNLAIKDSRRRASERAYLQRWGPAEPVDSWQPEVEARHEVVALLGSLPPRQRAVVVLRYYEDLSEKDIAATLGWPLGSVKSSLSRALAAMRISLGEGTHDE